MSKLTLDSVEWGVFFLNDIFREVKRGKRLTKSSQISGDTPYISSTGINNGVDNFIGNEQGVRLYSNSLSLANSGSVGSCFYHSYEYIASDHVTALYSDQANKYMYIFLSTVVGRLSEKYSFNREINDKRILREKILLPICSDGSPNWQFMEDYIKQEMKEQSQKVVAYYEDKLLKLGFELLDYDVEWKEFKVKEIFKFPRKLSKGLNHIEKDKDGISYLGATNRNNGVLDFVKDNESMKYKGNCIAFIRNGEGSMGYSIYKKEDFIATQDISVGYNEQLDEYSGKFLTTIADRVRGKYNFGYKRNQNRLENEILTLPVDKNGNPHWDYMRQFMMELEKENINNVLNHIYIYMN